MNVRSIKSVGAVMPRFLAVSSISVVAFGCMLSPAFAQTPRAGGPFAGLFGGVTQKASQSLDFRGSLFGVEQRAIVPAGEAEAPDPRLEEGGRFAGAALALNYAYDRHLRRVGVIVNGGASVAGYSVQPEQLSTTFNLSTAITAKVRPKIDFVSSAGMVYSPYYGLGLLSSSALIDPTVPASEFGFATIASRNFTMNGAVGATANLTKRSSLVLGGDFQETYLIDRSTNDVSTLVATDDVQTVGAHATFNHNLTRTMAFHLGYGRSLSSSSVPDARPFSNDQIDGGLTYGDSLPLSRRTSLSFGSSTSLMRIDSQSHFRLNGNVALAGSVARTWTASISFVRDSGFLAGFREPVLSDSANASFGGLLASRVRWTSGAGWLRGQIGFDTSDHYTSYYATSGIAVAIARRLGVYTQYAYSHYQVPRASTTLAILSRSSRQTVIAGLTVWVPIISARRGSS